MHFIRLVLVAVGAARLSLAAATSRSGLLQRADTQQSIYSASPPAPTAPEDITVIELPLPPVAPSNAIGSCTKVINSRGTGCIGKVTGLGSGNFLPDNKHVVAS
ncbi:hypothetical protein VE04_08934, partial [Pseudogymnoascus sp. 24MN13]